MRQSTRCGSAWFPLRKNSKTARDTFRTNQGSDCSSRSDRLWKKAENESGKHIVCCSYGHRIPSPLVRAGKLMRSPEYASMRDVGGMFNALCDHPVASRPRHLEPVLSGPCRKLTLFKRKKSFLSRDASCEVTKIAMRVWERPWVCVCQETFCRPKFRDAVPDKRFLTLSHKDAFPFWPERRGANPREHSNPETHQQAD